MRTLASGSLRPYRLSGSGRRHLAMRRARVTKTVGSPRSLVPTSPSASRWSPRSTWAVKRRSSSSPEPSRVKASCRSPDQSRRTAKAMPPWSRISSTRPATVTRSPERAAGGSPGWAARIAARVCVRRASTGYGSTPAARSRSSFRRRTRTCSGRPASSSAAAPAPASPPVTKPSSDSDGRPAVDDGLAMPRARPRRHSWPRLGTATKPSAMPAASPMRARAPASA